MNKYKVFYNNEIREMTDSEFQKTQANVDVSKISRAIFDFYEANKTDDNINNYKIKIYSKSLAIIYDNDTCFPISLLKNSGTNSTTNKRIAITKNHYSDMNQTFKYIYPIAVVSVSSQPAELIYFLVENSKEFIENYVLNSSKNTYSSFWLNEWDTFINYAKLDKSDEDFSGFWAEMELKRHRLNEKQYRNYFITNNFRELTFKMENINNDSKFNDEQDSKKIVEKIKTNEIFLDEYLEKIEEYSLPFNFELEDDSELVDSRLQTKRNKQMIDFYLQGHQKCECCNTSTTFTMESSREYFEVHHFIPCNLGVQKFYVKKLDNYTNLISLCPSCHRFLHFANNKERKQVLERLFKEKFSKNGFVNIFKEYDIEDLCDQYNQTYNLKVVNQNEK